MEAQAKAPHSTVRAFTGREFVSYEYRPVPADCYDEAARLEAGGYLELKHGPPAAAPVNPLEALTVKQLRNLAKEQGIAYFGLKKSKLIAALDEVEQ